MRHADQHQGRIQALQFQPGEHFRPMLASGVRVEPCSDRRVLWAGEAERQLLDRDRH